MRRSRRRCADTAGFGRRKLNRAPIPIDCGLLYVPITTGAQPLGDSHNTTPALSLPGSTQFLSSGKEKAAGTYTVELYCQDVDSVAKIKNVNLMAWAG